MNDFPAGAPAFRGRRQDFGLITLNPGRPPPRSATENDLLLGEIIVLKVVISPINDLIFS